MEVNDLVKWKFGHLKVLELLIHLQELLTIKSDDIKGRHQVMDAILKNKTISLGTPESFKVLIRELQSLCLDVGVYSIDSTGHRKQIDVMKLP